MSVTTNLHLQKYTDGDAFDAPSMNATLDTLDNQVGGGGGAYTKGWAILNAGDVAAGAMADVVGLSVTITTTKASVLTEARLHAVFATTGFSIVTIRFDIDGAAQTYDFPVINYVNGSGGDVTNTSVGSCGIAFVLTTPGSHTIKIRMSGTNATLYADATTPATLIVDYRP